MKKFLTLAAVLAAGVMTMHAQGSARTALTAGSLFATSQETGLSYVLAYNPDRFLAPAYTALGKTPKASSYGGWESRQIQGHMLGHYLSALAGFYYQTGSLQAKEKLDYTVACIKDLQREDGYFGGIPSTPFDTVFKSGGSFNVDRFSLADWWVPWYSVHKIYAGLLDAYTYGGNKDALTVVKGMADWAISGTSRMTDSELQKMLGCEHGGMCKVFADLYGITGDQRYLQEAERWIHKEIMTPAMKKQDKLQGYHANTQIPKFLGIARLYELTGKPEYRTAAEFFFETVTERRSYAIGGNSKGEHFGREYDETLSRDTAETCNTYNMLELAEHIFAWNAGSPEARKAADFYETALYNHILASQDPESGAKTYFVALQPGFFKVYCTHDNAMWCCTGTGLENPERYNRFIAFDAEEVLYINLFIDSTVTTSDGWKVRIESRFPYEEQVHFSVLQAGRGTKTLKVRAPAWCRPLAEKAGADGYLDLGSLSAGTDVSLALPMALTVRRALDRSGNFSLKYGPIVLAADLGAKALPADTVDDQLVYMNSGSATPPELITADLKNPAGWIEAADKASLTFTTAKSANAKGISYTLRPFFALHHTRYAAYFPSTNALEDKRTASFEKITVDFVEPGRQQSEVEHKFKTEGTEIGYLDSVDRNYRAFTADGASLVYKLKFDLAAKQNRIVLTVYGADKGSLSLRYGSTELETVTLKGDGGDQLVDISVEMPKKLLQAKQKGAKVVREDVTVQGSAGTRLLEMHVVNK